MTRYDRPARRAALLLLPLLAAVSGVSCGGRPPAGGAAGPRGPGGPGVTPLEGAGRPPAAVARTVYVPVYSHVYTADAGHPFNLAVTLSVRNTDRAEPIVLTSVRYHDSAGRPLREELTRPVRVAPLAAAEFFVKESDTSGGVSASYLVDWQAGKPVSEPVIEAVMVGTSMNQGVSFISPGRVVGEPSPPR